VKGFVDDWGEHWQKLSKNKIVGLEDSGFLGNRIITEIVKWLLLDSEIRSIEDAPSPED